MKAFTVTGRDGHTLIIDECGDSPGHVHVATSDGPLCTGPEDLPSIAAALYRSAGKPAPDIPASTAATAKDLADTVTALAGYAMAFGRIDRTACLHPDGMTPESDSDHTVMLGWIAPAFADRHFPGLNAGLVAQFALIHDAVEVFAGDTQTLRIDDDGRMVKAARERAAAARWRIEFLGALPWMPRMIDRYEMQLEPEARFVRALDKILPKFVHAQNECADLLKFGMTADELEVMLSKQHADMETYAGEFGMLMDLHTEMAARVVATLRKVGFPPDGGA